MWQVQHLEDLTVILRGRCSTRSTSREVRGSPATIEYYGRRLRWACHLEVEKPILVRTGKGTSVTRYGTCRTVEKNRKKSW